MSFVVPRIIACVLPVRMARPSVAPPGVSAALAWLMAAARSRSSRLWGPALLRDRRGLQANAIGLASGRSRDGRYGRDREGDEADVSGTFVDPGGATAAKSAGSSAVMVVPMFCEIAIAETRVRVGKSSG